MVAYKDRAPMASQRVRVFQHRVVIRQMLFDGHTIKGIKETVGLDDMPYDTFYHHVTKLRDAPQPAMIASPDAEPAPSPVRISNEEQPPKVEQSKDAEQPERESFEEKPKRKPARKRRKFVDGTAEYEKENPKQELRPWNPEEARNIK